jgi:hypothetical protein
MARVVCFGLRLGDVSLVSCWADGMLRRRTWRSHFVCVLMCKVIEDGELLIDDARRASFPPPCHVLSWADRLFLDDQPQPWRIIPNQDSSYNSQGHPS